MLANLKGYRTLIVNGVLMIPPALQVLHDVLSMPEILPLIPVEYKPYYALLIALANVWLRTITTTPVGKK